LIREPSLVSSPLFRPIEKVQFYASSEGNQNQEVVSKRFKITASGKVLTQHAGKRHLLSSKNANRRRRLGTAKLVHKTDVYKIKACLPFSH